MTMGMDLAKNVRTRHYALMGAGAGASGVGLAWDGPPLARGALLLGGLVMLGATAWLMEKHRAAQE